MSGNYLSMLKKRSWRKTLAVAVTAGILAGGYSTAFAAEVAQTAAEKTYNKTLTGVYNEDKATYKDVLSENNGQYNFGEGAKVTIDAGDVLALDFDKNNGVNENIVLSAKNGSITLKSASQSNTATQIIAARMTHVGNFTFDAADTNIIASSNNKSHAATGILVEGSDTHGQTAVNVKGNLNVNASGSGADSYSSVAGVLAKGDGVLTVEGNLVMKDENGSWGVKGGDQYGYASTAGIKTDINYDTRKGGTVNVKGLTDLVVDGSGVVVQTKGNVNLDGDVKIKINKNDSKVMYSVAATSGGVANINMNAGRDGAGDKTVNIEGNVGAVSGFDSGTTVNIGLSNEQSTLNGVVVNTTNARKPGQVNLYINNNALWTNESYGAVDRGFTGSNVGKFVGGSDASHAGFVLQKDSRPLTIGRYSGHTVLVYEHINDGSNASDFAAGDTHIKNAAAGSGIVMSTDNNGIDVNNQDLVKKVLNNLAGKLYYDAYVNGEKNLTGIVQIASGLTGSSISKELTGQMAFSDANGQGSVVEGTIKPPIPEHQTTTDFTTSITGDRATDDVYVKSGILKENGEYVFEKNTNINIATSDTASGITAKGNVVVKAEGSTLNINSKGKFGIDNTVGFSNKNNPYNVTITADKLNVSHENAAGRAEGIHILNSYSKNDQTDKVAKVVINGDTNINAYGVDYTIGAYVAGNSLLEINGNVAMKGQGDKQWGIDNDGTSSVGYHSISGLYAGATYGGNPAGGKIVVNGNVDLAVNGTGVLANGNGSSVVINGGGTILTNKDNQDVHYALAAENGSVSMNMNKDNTAAGTNKVDIKGNIGVLNGAVNDWDIVKDTTLNIGLSTADSVLTGVAVNNFTKEQLEAGNKPQLNMYVSNGATWNNEAYGNVVAGFAGSKVDKFVGGSDASHAGYIVQKDANALTIGNYSGHSYLVYEHINDGTNASDFTAGDTHIKNAAAGSGVTMVTDNTGIDVNNFDQVSKVLNNLAGKLYYDAYVTGEKNLTGKVQIASGLTGSAISQDLASGDMGFSETTGQGNVVGETIKPQPKPEPPAHQTEVNFSETITGNIETDKVYVDSGILKENGEYVFEKDSNITMSGTDAALNAKNDVVIKAEGSTLNFVTNAGENAGQAIKNAAGKNINITADKTVVKVESTSGRVDGIYMSKGDITVNGALDVTAVGNGAQGVYANSGNHTFNGDVKINVDGKGGGWGHYGASGLYATSTMGDSKGSTITVNGMVDISGNGNGIYANAGGSSVTVQGGKIVVNDKDNKGYGAIRAENGVVNMNAKLDESGKLVGGNGKLVDITGNIVAGTGAVNPADKNGTKTAINLALDTEKSKLHGLIINEFPEEGKQAGSLTFTGETNLVLQNGATWINESVKAEQAAKTLAAEGAGAQGSYVTNFIGGKDMASAGVIVQKDTNALTIGNYSGNTKIVYEHTVGAAKNNDISIIGGNVVIKNAEKDSKITIATDGVGIKVDNKDSVKDVMNKLAEKFEYGQIDETSKNNLGIGVKIDEGLTSDGWKAETDEFGNVKEETIQKIPGKGLSNGDYETLMMYGARAAMVDSMVAWRDTTAESFVRADELHKGAEDGAWVRINRGKVDYSGAGTEINGNFYGVQTGFDKSMGDGWTAGLMFDYRDGDSDYKMGSEGEHKLYGMGIYGTKDLGSNDYIDVVAKFGKVENDFIARNETGKELSGEYSAAAYSMSAQYGKRFEDSNGGYFEPQAQLTWSHVNSDTYDAHCGDQVMNIDQTAFDSFVGRLGVQAGQITDNGQAYVRLSVAHEFAGDIDGVYLAKDGGLKTTQYNAGDTWSELNIGGSYKLSKCANFYADITKTLTGDYKQDWKFNAGMSFSF